jgi:hypothetical protein
MPDPYRATINGKASGVWAAELGTPVEVIDHAANGRAVLVRMPEDARLCKKAGRLCWIPSRWVDEEPAPRTCPVCGAPIESQHPTDGGQE